MTAEDARPDLVALADRVWQAAGTLNTVAIPEKGQSDKFNDAVTALIKVVNELRAARLPSAPEPGERPPQWLTCPDCGHAEGLHYGPCSFLVALPSSQTCGCERRSGWMDPAASHAAESACTCPIEWTGIDAPLRGHALGCPRYQPHAAESDRCRHPEASRRWVPGIGEVCDACSTTWAGGPIPEPHAAESAEPETGLDVPTLAEAIRLWYAQEGRNPRTGSYDQPQPAWLAAKYAALRAPQPGAVES